MSRSTRAAARHDKAVGARERRPLVLAGLILAVAVVAALATARPTWAAVTTITTDSMSIFVGDTGRLNARLVGNEVNTFYPPNAEEGDAGVTIGFPTTAANPSALDGRAFQFGEFERVSQSPVDASTGTQVTVFRAPSANATSGVQVVQTVHYARGRGDTFFDVVYDVTVLGGAALNFRLSASADLYVDDTDFGVGQLRPGRALFGVNPEPNGGTGGIVERTPWSRYFEGDYVLANEIPRSPNGVGYPNTVEPRHLDNGVGVQFDTYATGAGLAPGTTATFAMRWEFTAGDLDGDGVSNSADNCREVRNPDQTDLDGDDVGDACDEPDEDSDGVPDSADNCRAVGNRGQEDADADGIGDVCDREEKDRDGDGVADNRDNCADVRNADQQDRDGDRVGDVCDPEPHGPDADRDTILDGADNCRTLVNADQRDADADGIGDACDRSNGAVPPVVGKTATVRAVSGTVLILKGKTYVPLNGAESIPMGSTVDATKGVVQITTASGKGANATQQAKIAAAIFQLRQQRARAGTGAVAADIVLKGQAFPKSCSPTKQRPGKPRKQTLLRQVTGTAKGLWRTVARASVTTVTNGQWTTQDRCDGTLTTVVKGKASVKNTVTGRTVQVKAGKRYLAAMIFAAKQRRSEA